MEGVGWGVGGWEVGGGVRGGTCGGQVTPCESVLLSGAGIEFVSRFGGWCFYLLRRFPSLPFISCVCLSRASVSNSFEN